MCKDTILSRIFSRFRQILKGLLMGTNLTIIILLWFTCLTTMVSPVSHPRLSQAGLLFPIFFFLNVSFIFTWLLVSWRWILLPLIGTFCCWSFVRDFYPINIGTEKNKESICIMSYNVGNFANDSQLGFKGEETIEYILESEADIICLQECPLGHLYEKLSKQLKKKEYFVREKNGLATISKWPFIGSTIQQPDDIYSNGSFANFININGDTILLINNHLQSNSISHAEKAEYANAIETYNTDKIEASGRILLSRISQAAAKRSKQTDIVCSLIDEYKKYDVIVAGDFNDTPISTTYQRISKKLKCAFRNAGNGVGVSFLLKGFPVRIDHIFVSNDMNVYSTNIDNKIKSSDHHPIITRVTKSSK